MRAPLLAGEVYRAFAAGSAGKYVFVSKGGRMPPELLRVGLLGLGSIGATVAAELRRGAVPSAELTAVLRRQRSDDPAQVSSLAELVDRSDVVVEAAGPSALQEHVVPVLAAGRDLVAVSVGALLDDQLRDELDRLPAWAGRLVLCPGAIGGFDLLRAATMPGPPRWVRLTSRKAPRSLVQPWMGEELVARLTSLGAGDEPLEVFAGGVRAAVEKFPNNMNIAATLGLAVGDVELVEVRLLADPRAERTRHVIEAETALGDYRFDIANEASAANPASSAVVAYSALRCLAESSPHTWRVG